MLNKYALILIVLLYAVPLLSQVNLQEGLVAYYPFNGNANDASGYENHGIVEGATLTTDPGDKPNSAYRFAGNGDNINCGNDISLNMDQKISCVAWVKVDSMTGWNGIVTNFGGGQGDRSYYLGIDDEGDNFVFQVELQNLYTVYQAIDSSIIKPNIWYFLVGTYDGQNLKLYKNKQLIVSKKLSGDLEDCSHNIRIGTNEPHNHDFYGTIDEVRIYNRAINFLEIDSLYRVNGWDNGTNNNPPIVSNVTFNQRSDGSFRVDVYYDLNDDDGDTMTVEIQVSDDAGETWDFSCEQISGSMGESITGGTDKHIVWDFGAEHPQTFGDQFQIKILADDGQ